MIYNKEANFPYPVLCNTSDSYSNSYFLLDVTLQENNSDYKFTIKYDIGSSYLKSLIENDIAQLLLVIQSKDNKFFFIEKDQYEKSIPKNRISISKRTTLQLMIRANKSINMINNYDLNAFYNNYKEHIIIPSYSILGFSNTVIFDGSTVKPFEIFEKKLDPTLDSDIAIEIGEESIILKYRDESFQFSSYPNSVSLNYPYVYMGLQKALYKLIVECSDDMESIDLDYIDPPTHGLSFKLYNLLKSKFIKELSISNMDSVISKISDNIIKKYVTAIKGISENGN